MKIIKNNWKVLIFILISLGVGFLSFLVTKNNQDIYQYINTPSFAPNPKLFPIVWTILYFLMGISSYLIYKSNSNDKNTALFVYGIQLLINFIWPIIFFNMKNFLLSFLWICLLLFYIGLMIYNFSLINKKAAIIQIPYLLWAIFASVLNLSIYLLNK